MKPLDSNAMRQLSIAHMRGRTRTRSLVSKMETCRLVSLAHSERAGENASKRFSPVQALQERARISELRGQRRLPTAWPCVLRRWLGILGHK